MASRKDLILGRILVERGILTERQLDECARGQQQLPQDPEQTVGTSRVRPLSAVVMERRLVDERRLVELLEEQNRRLAIMETYDRMVKAELVFGQLLVRFNKATQNQINKCLEIQQKLAEKGTPIPRLGELLVQHGFVEARTVQEILKMQRKDVLLCTNCGKQFNVIGVEPGKTYKCRFCDGIMVTRAQLDTLKAEETAFGFELPTTDGPSP